MNSICVLCPCVNVTNDISGKWPLCMPRKCQNDKTFDKVTTHFFRPNDYSGLKKNFSGKCYRPLSPWGLVLPCSCPPTPDQLFVEWSWPHRNRKWFFSNIGLLRFQNWIFSSKHAMKMQGGSSPSHLVSWKGIFMEGTGAHRKNKLSTSSPRLLIIKQFRYSTIFFLKKLWRPIAHGRERG